MHNATTDKWKLVAKRLLTTIGKSEGAVYTAVWAALVDLFNHLFYGLHGARQAVGTTGYLQK